MHKITQTERRQKYKHEGTSDDDLKGSEEYVIGYWIKGDLCYKVAQKLAGFCSAAGSVNSTCK